MSYLDQINSYDYGTITEKVERKSALDVEQALAAEQPDEEDLLALLSPAAAPFLEQMAQRSHQVTSQRFGKTILLYAPLYLSNECANGCTYCGFSADNQVTRRTLSMDEIIRDARVLHDWGFRHVLLLTGEAPARIGVDFLEEAVGAIKHLFSSISLEVFPMEEDEYARLINAGVDGLTVYQETYDRELYDELHPFGPKRDYDFRLLTPERGGAAGLRRIGIGSLLGLGNPYAEAFFTALHARYLMKAFWRTHITVSFPRIRPAEGGFAPREIVSDRQLVQMICAMRIFMSDVGLVLSTRESAEFRDNLLPLGITQMSAGSSTAPGGYGEDEDDRETEQFAIDDDRDPHQFAQMLRDNGYDPVWKDWDSAFSETA